MTDNNIGIIGPDTLVGSTIILEDDTQYTLVEHFADGSGVGVQTDEDSPPENMSYDEWNEEYAPFVKEVAFPEQAPPEAPASTAPEPVASPTMCVSAYLLADVDDAMSELREAESTHNTLKDQASVAKKEEDKAQVALNEAVDALLRGQVTRDGWPKDSPLAGVAKTGEGSNDLALLGVDDEPDNPETDDQWRFVILSTLSKPCIKPGVLKALADAEILTMGDLADRQAKDSDFWAKNIKGVGKAAQDAIAEATDAYWARQAE